MFKIYEHLTKQYILQSKNRNILKRTLNNLNQGSFFKGNTPKFMVASGPITVDGQQNTRNI